MAKLLRMIAERTRDQIRSDHEFRIYEYPLGAGSTEQPFERIRVNNPQDLNDYHPDSPSDPSVDEFRARVHLRMEGGQCVFTYAEHGLLLHYGWLIPRTMQMGSEYGHKIPTPNAPAILWDDFTHSTARGRGLHQESLRARLSYAASQALSQVAMIGVRANNGPSRHNIEKVGFRHCGSAWMSIRMGYVRRWVIWVSASRGGGVAG